MQATVTDFTTNLRGWEFKIYITARFYCKDNISFFKTFSVCKYMQCFKAGSKQGKQTHRKSQRYSSFPTKRYPKTKQIPRAHLEIKTRTHTNAHVRLYTHAETRKEACLFIIMIWYKSHDQFCVSYLYFCIYILIFHIAFYWIWTQTRTYRHIYPKS